MNPHPEITAPALDRQALSDHLVGLIDYFESLTPQSVDTMGMHYAETAWFKDPFNEVVGLERIAPIFKDMFEQVLSPRFVVHSAIEQNQQAFIAWDFLFEMKRFKQGEVQRCRGSSHLKFDEYGKVIFHRDYWDTSEELYEKIPVLGALMRWLKKQAG